MVGDGRRHYDRSSTSFGGGTDFSDLVRVGQSLGLNLDPSEARAFQRPIATTLQMIQEFVESEVGADAPSLIAGPRDAGFEPGPADDQYGAWAWRCRITGSDSGLLSGHLVSFKDNIAVAGVPLRLGTRLMEPYVPDFDATVVARVLAHGGTVVGKNTMSGPVASGDGAVLAKQPVNPHDREAWPGASSSGCAIAVAAGEVDIAFGGDQGGSVRMPAAYCGTYGLKPTFGLLSQFGIVSGSDQSIDHTGPLARDARTLAAALDAVAGYDGYDPRQDRSVPTQTQTLNSLDHGVEGMRLGLLEEGFEGAAPDVGDAVLAAVDVLTRAGAASVARVSIPEHNHANIAMAALQPEGNRALVDVGILGAHAKTYYPTSLIAAVYRLFRTHLNQLTPRRKLALLLSEYSRNQFHGAAYAKAQNARRPITRAVDRAFERFDLLIMPTCLTVAPRTDEAVAQMAFDPIRHERNTAPYNFTGHPALTVPCGKSGRLPIGMQLVAPYYGESLLLRAAFSFEHSVNWPDLISIHN